MKPKKKQANTIPHWAHLWPQCGTSAGLDFQQELAQPPQIILQLPTMVPDPPNQWLHTPTMMEKLWLFDMNFYSSVARRKSHARAQHPTLLSRHSLT